MSTSYFAQVQNGVVVFVESVTQDVVDARANASEFVRCWYQANGDPTKFYNYPGVGYSFDGVAFKAPQPYPSWSLNAVYQWEPPTPYPDDGLIYRWDEPTTSWVEA